MKYLSCPMKSCNSSIWGCEQAGKIFYCEHCWKIPGMGKVVSCPEGAPTENRNCSRHEGGE